MKVRNPVLRRKIREAIAETVISGFTKYLADNNITTRERKVFFFFFEWPETESHSKEDGGNATRAIRRVSKFPCVLTMYASICVQSFILVL